MKPDYIRKCVEGAEKDVLEMSDDDFCPLHEEWHGDCIIKSVAEWRVKLGD